MNLYYTLEENGYHIYDEEDALFHIHQYPPYDKPILKDGTYEENAKAHIEELTKTDEQRKEEIIQEYRNQLASEVNGNA